MAVVGLTTKVVFGSVTGVTDGVCESELEANCGEVVFDATVDAEVSTVIVVEGAVTLGLDVVAEVWPVSEALEVLAVKNVPVDDRDVKVGTSKLFMVVVDLALVLARSDAENVFD